MHDWTHPEKRERERKRESERQERVERVRASERERARVRTTERKREKVKWWETRAYTLMYTHIYICAVLASQRSGGLGTSRRPPYLCIVAQRN